MILDGDEGLLYCLCAPHPIPCLWQGNSIATIHQVDYAKRKSKTRSSDDKHDFGRAGSKVELRDKLKNTGIQAEPHLWNMVLG